MYVGVRASLCLCVWLSVCICTCVHMYMHACVHMYLSLILIIAYTKEHCIKQLNKCYNFLVITYGICY